MHSDIEQSAQMHTRKACQCSNTGLETVLEHATLEKFEKMRAPSKIEMWIYT